MTGTEIQLEDAYILDRSEAYRALRELRGKLKALERLIADLGELERVEMPDRRTGRSFIRTDSRMVCLRVAEALSSLCLERKLFIRWSEWKAKRKETCQKLRAQSTEVSSDIDEKPPGS
jgi:hypothetical protein